MLTSSGKHIKIIGHRGARGLYPENTVISFIEAIKWGADAIELDVVISKDRQVVVSHEPWMNEEFCRKPNGEKIEPNSREKYNLYEMTYEEISTFDCGKNGNANFPQQKAMPVKKPLLSEVFRKIESFTRSNNLKPVVYVIEIKSEIQDDTIFQPAPDEFVNLVCKVIAEYNVMERCILQSFDVRILQELHINYSQTRIAFLVENNESLQTNLRSLGFVPPIYSPEFILANQELMTQLQQLDIQFVPWTVNEIKDMKQMIELGATGIITDYPNHAAELIRQL